MDDKNFGDSIRAVFQASLNTIDDPPKSILPLTATNINAPNIENAWTTSVHTTAFNPPYKYSKRINIKC